MNLWMQDSGGSVLSGCLMIDWLCGARLVVRGAGVVELCVCELSGPLGTAIRREEDTLYRQIDGRR